MKKESTQYKFRDIMEEVSLQLSDLIGTMDVIYEGLYTGAMGAQAHHCISVLRQSAENIQNTIEKGKNIYVSDKDEE